MEEENTPLGFGGCGVLVDIVEVGVDAGGLQLPQVAAVVKSVEFDGGCLHRAYSLEIWNLADSVIIN